MTKATVVFDNSDLIEKGAYVDPTTTVEFSGPGWYALNENCTGFIKVSSSPKDGFKTMAEAERTDYTGTPHYLGSFSELEQWMRD